MGFELRKPDLSLSPQHLQGLHVWRQEGDIKSKSRKARNGKVRPAQGHARLREAGVTLSSSRSLRRMTECVGDVPVSSGKRNKTYQSLQDYFGITQGLN